jgi:hypothetical protein
MHSNMGHKRRRSGDKQRVSCIMSAAFDGTTWVNRVTVAEALMQLFACHHQLQACAGAGWPWQQWWRRAGSCAPPHTLRLHCAGDRMRAHCYPSPGNTA